VVWQPGIGSAIAVAVKAADREPRNRSQSKQQFDVGVWGRAKFERSLNEGGS
jgi:hypothetical protein